MRSRALRAWGWKERPNPGPEWAEDSLGEGPPRRPRPDAPHQGRHSAASYLIEAGLNDLELTATIGHSDSRTTKRIYGHLFSDSSAAIAAKLDAYHAVGSSEERFTDSVTDNVPKNDENPAFAGHS